MEHNRVNKIELISKTFDTKSLSLVYGFNNAAKRDTLLKDLNNNQSSEIANWGLNNNYPKEVMEDLRKSSIAKTAFENLANVHVGSGVTYYYEMLDADGNGRFKVFPIIEEIEEFMDSNNVNSIQKSIVLDLETLYNAFPEIILNKANTKVVRYNHNKAFYCRFEKKNEQGVINNVYISSKWPHGTKEDWAIIPILNIDKKIKPKSIIPLCYPSQDEGLYYSLPHWDSIRNNGWLDVASLVPAAKKSIYQNQAVLKYHVNVDLTYFANSCEGWHEWNSEKQQQKIDELLEDIEKMLTDVNNYGKSLFTFSPIGSDGKPMEYISIRPIDNSKLSDEKFLPDSAAANAEILFAIGLNPSIVGVGIPGTRASQGSGSYVREELWKMQALIRSRREESLKPLKFISKINGWNKYVPKGSILKWSYKDISTLATLDKNPNGKSEMLGEDNT